MQQQRPEFDNGGPGKPSDDELYPFSTRENTGFCRHTLPSRAMLNAACIDIVARLKRSGMPEDAAVEQALRFAGRFASPGAAGTDYDATLAAVAEAVR